MIRAKTPARPGRRALRGVGTTVLGLLVLGGIAHGAAWFWLTGAMTDALSDWVTQQRARGWVIDHGPPGRAGWPFAARLTVPGVRIAGWSPVLPQGFIWEAGRVHLSLGPPQIDRLIIAADGPQRITSASLSIPYTATRLQTALPLDGGARPVEVLLEGLHAETPDGPVTAGRVDARVTPAGGADDVQLGLLAEAWQVTLPSLPGLAAFGRDVDSMRLDAVLTGPPPAPYLTSPRGQAEAWRAGGGRLDLRSVSLHWGSLAGEARMDLRLDAALQPTGDGRLILERPAQVIASLAAAGVIAPRAAIGAQAVAGMMARVPEGGGAPRLDVPVGIADGTVSVARIPLFRLRPITWPVGTATLD